MLKVVNISKRCINIGSYDLKPGKSINLNNYELNDSIYNKIQSLLSINFIKIFVSDDLIEPQLNNTIEIPEETEHVEIIESTQDVKTEKSKSKTSKKK